MNNQRVILRIVSLLFCLICFLQLSGLKGIANYLSVALLLAVIFLLMLDSEWSFQSSSILILLFIVFYTLTSLPHFDSSYYPKYVANYLIIFSPAIISNYCYRKCVLLRLSRINTLLTPVIVIWFFMVYVSIAFYLYNPSAARVLARDGDAFEGSLIGGYHLAYGSSLLCIAFFGCLIRNLLEGKLRYCVIVLCVSLLAVVYLTESTLTTFATIVGLVVTVLTNKKDRNIGPFYLFLVIFVFCSIVVVCTLIESNFTAISAWLEDNSSVLIFRRISEILNSIFLDDQTRHYSERQSLVAQSLDLFLNSPLIGHGYKYGNVFIEGKEYGIGNHSEIFDSLARYGLIGTVPLFLLYYRTAKQICQKNIGVVIAFVILVTFNPFISFAANLSFFLLIPMIYYAIDENNPKGKNTISRWE